MKYRGISADIAQANSKTGVLLVNLGSPDRPVCPSLRKYLGEFLYDPRVIELPRFFRWLLVKGIIVNVRSHKSAAVYRKIWTENGSPLVHQTAGLAAQLSNLLSDQFIVKTAMRYGSPSIESQINALFDEGVRTLKIVALYPQYSGSTSGSVFDASVIHARQRVQLASLEQLAASQAEMIGRLSNSEA